MQRDPYSQWMKNPDNKAKLFMVITGVMIMTTFLVVIGTLIVILMLVGCEFFIHYGIKFKHKKEADK